MRRREFLKALGGLGALGVVPGLGTSSALAKAVRPSDFSY